ncbi:uncharacterized protein LOC132550537 [Ylistrum balloti]|uniref:uncharacterized protein LOC132550537 n=1 Tax=Ylistrum balloti TaxID=509963 RepID=UPI002905B4F8|nr:uncharacterized protein LOC132550537 [Ylistrum balloti]
MLRACLSRDHLQSFYQNFDRIITETSIYSDSLESRSSEMKRMIFFRTSVTWFGAVISFAGIIFQSVTDFNKDFAAGITNPFPQRNIAALLFFSGLHLWETGAWLFPILLQSTLFTFLGNSFSTLNTNLIRIMEDNDKRISQNIKDLRRKHLQLCKTVAILEQDTSYLLTGTYVTNVFLICFIVYQMVTAGSWPIYSYVSFSSWVLMNVTVILTISHTAAKVNEKAHSHLEYLYDVDMSQASPFESLELQMFLSKLNGPPLGFTVLGFVTITKEFILTLGGIIMTYFFLLLQFKL